MRPVPRPWRIALAVASCLLLVGFAFVDSSPRVPEKSDYERAVARLDTAIEMYAGRASRGANLFDLEQLGSLWTARAELTGAEADFGAAQDALERAFRMAPPRDAPHLARARLKLLRGHFDEALSDLMQAEKVSVATARFRSALEELRGAVFDARGDRGAAEQSFQTAMAAKRTPSLLARFGRLRWRQGDARGAETLFAEARALAVTREEKARVELLRGELCQEAGDLACALSRYRRAASEFSGWAEIEARVSDACHRLRRAATPEDLAARTD